jgi:protein-tyrosine phosphatase
LIDLHSHILPALDDGALDMADSIAMARVAADDGITVVCATPHIRDDHDVRIEELPERVAALQSELDRRGVAVRIARGAEVAQRAAARLEPAQLRELSLDGGGWILLEPAPGPLSVELRELVERLAAAGAPVVLVHPERHAGADFEQHLRELSARGCLIQWTADFIARQDPAGDGAPVMGLARAGLVHLLASDAHSSHGGRPLRLSPGVRRLREVCGAAQVEWIVEQAPAAILRGERPKPPW